jgi:hypothetical protein
MKKIAIMVALVAAFGCSVNVKLMTSNELGKWKVNSDTIYFENKAVAVYDHSEYELNPSHGRHAKTIQELSITQTSFDIKIEELIRYVHTVHSKQKVEIVVPRH